MYAISNLYAHESFDSRLLALAVTVAFSASLGLIINLHNFDNRDFLWLRNLPIPLPRRFLSLLLTLLLLNITEYALLSRNFLPHLATFEILAACVFGLTIQMLFYSGLFLIRDQKNITRVMFMILVTWWVLILFKTPMPVLCALNLAASATIYFKRYYAYQAVS